MNLKALSSHFGAVAVGALAALALSSSGTKPAAAPARVGAVSFERRPDGCYCFIAGAPDTKANCRNAALAGSSVDDFEVALKTCEGK